MWHPQHGLWKCACNWGHRSFRPKTTSPHSPSQIVPVISISYQVTTPKSRFVTGKKEESVTDDTMSYYQISPKGPQLGRLDSVWGAICSWGELTYWLLTLYNFALGKKCVWACLEKRAYRITPPPKKKNPTFFFLPLLMTIHVSKHHKQRELLTTFKIHAVQFVLQDCST